MKIDFSTTITLLIILLCFVHEFLANNGMNVALYSQYYLNLITVTIWFCNSRL